MQRLETDIVCAEVKKAISLSLFNRANVKSLWPNVHLLDPGIFV